MALAGLIGEKLNRLGLANVSGDAESVLARLSAPASVGLRDRMLSRTDLQTSGCLVPHGSSAPMFMWLCGITEFIEVRPEQACAIEINMNAKAAIDAAIRKNFFDISIRPSAQKANTLPMLVNSTL